MPVDKGPAPKRMALSRVRRKASPARRCAKFVGASEIENRGSLSVSTASQVLLTNNYCEIYSYIFNPTLGVKFNVFSDLKEHKI